MSLFFFFFCSSALFAFVSSRPQTDPGNAISEGDVRVPILDQESNAPEIDYNRLGSPSACGFSSKNLSSIARTGGGVARLRDWPWMGAILRKNDQFHFCGGALISQRRLLTAAHCVYNLKKEDIFVRLGEYDFTRENDTQINDFDVTRMQIHDDWDSGTFENDIAILTFNEPVRYNFYTQPICLPLPVQDFTNTTAVVAGWGSIMFGGPMSDILLEVPVPVWDQKRCVDQFTQTIFSTVQCAAAYEGGKDACQGDSGGPLMSQREDGRWITIGIVSWGINCGEKDKPGIYTRVNRYLDWIAEKLQE